MKKFELKKVFAKNNKASMLRKASVAMGVTGAMLSMTATTALAGSFGEDVKISSKTDQDAAGLMGKVIGILLTITRFVGVALVIYGVYEIVMSFMQNQPEAKTKGIIMALAGIVMVGLKSILQSIGILSK